jgi:putative holliday junction resolvase
MAEHGAIISLDIGTVRTGVAISRAPVHIPSPLVTIPTNELKEKLHTLITSESVSAIVVGLPRNMSGESTQQTAYVEALIGDLELSVPYVFQDEAATSVKAKAELDARKKPYQKEDIDMLSAVYILEDYMQQHPEVIRV